MKSIKFATIFFLLVLGISSCSERLSGTWTVQKYEMIIPGQQTISLSNIGTIAFKSDHSGTRDIHYALLGTQHDNTSPFTWTFDKNYVTIKADDSDFSKTWLIKDNEKNVQRWQSTNGRGEIQTLELKRQ